MRKSTIITLITSLFATISFATPIPEAEPAPVDPPGLSTNDFPVNVIMLSGASQFGAWVPADGNLHYASTVSCLNVGAAATISCNIPVIDHIAAVNGYSCNFVGPIFNGQQTGTADSGFLTVGPPEAMVWFACGKV